MNRLILLILSLILSVNAIHTMVASGEMLSVSLECPEDVSFLKSQNITSGEVIATADNYSKKYEVKLLGELSSSLEAAVPITSCHDSRTGSGGDISVAISVGLAPDNSLTLGLAVPILNLFTLSGSFDVSQSYSFSATYDCTIPKGSRGQIWAAPFAITGSVQHRVVYFDKRGNAVGRSGWTSAYPAKVPSAASPMFSCRTDAYASCNIPVPTIKIRLADHIPEIN